MWFVRVASPPFRVFEAGWLYYSLKFLPTTSQHYYHSGTSVTAKHNELMFNLLWHTSLALLQFRQNSIRPGLGQANHNRLSNMVQV